MDMAELAGKCFPRSGHVETRSDHFGHRLCRAWRRSKFNGCRLPKPAPAPAGIGWSQGQRRAPGIRRQAQSYPATGPATFWRLMAHLDAGALEKIFLQVQEQIRGPAPPEELIVLDGKGPWHGAVAIPCSRR